MHVVSIVSKRPNSTTLVTYDEGKNIKLWNIVDMVCYQTIQTDTFHPFQTMICLTQRLVVGIRRLGDYEFNP